LIFEVELLSFKEKTKEKWEMSKEEVSERSIIYDMAHFYTHPTHY
tara:strand:- start:124 stop:258 length:135 start_codon:yes stop_codon:yes gene_type:complete